MIYNFNNNLNLRNPVDKRKRKYQNNISLNALDICTTVNFLIPYRDHRPRIFLDTVAEQKYYVIYSQDDLCKHNRYYD